MASCFELAWMIANPPISSFVSANGPSVTVNFPSESRTRAPAALGRHPSVAISQPASITSPINFPISAISCWVGGRSGLPGLYKHKNRIVVFLSLKRSTDTSNKGGQDRQVQGLFLLKIGDGRPGNVSHGRGARTRRGSDCVLHPGGRFSQPGLFDQCGKAQV